MVVLILFMVLVFFWFIGGLVLYFKDFIYMLIGLGIIGVYFIFGVFLVGLICFYDGGFVIKFIEKIEDFILVFFLFLYFVLFGLKINLGFFNDGIIWGYCIGVIVCVFVGKIIGGIFVVCVNKLFWCESFIIGVLMFCKGLVELIVFVSVV